MKATYILNDIEELEATVTIDATVQELRIVAKSLADKVASHGWDSVTVSFLNLFESIIQKAEEKFHREEV